MEIDNSQCSADVDSITLELVNQCLIKTNENARPIETTVLSKTVNGFNAGENLTVIVGLFREKNQSESISI